MTYKLPNLLLLCCLIWHPAAFSADPVAAPAPKEKPQLDNKAAEPAKNKKFIVHEWGVLQVGVDNGQFFLGTPDKELADLPPFVIHHRKLFNPNLKKATMKTWRKPVLHFYGPELLNVEINLSVKNSQPLVYWPQPEIKTKSDRSLARTIQKELVFCTALKWQGKLSLNNPGNLPEADPAHWWSDIRKVPGNYLITEKGNERFLFYEANALQMPVVNGQVTRKALMIHNNYNQQSTPVFIIINKEGKYFCKYIESIRPKFTIKLRKDDLFSKEWTSEEILSTVFRQWKAFGLNETEVKYMIPAWKKQLLNSQGFLLISQLPQTLYEQIFPMTINPKPDKFIRVGIILDNLGNERNRLSWFPKLEKEVHTLIKKLNRKRKSSREKAIESLIKIGNMATAPLMDLLRNFQAKDTNSYKNLKSITDKVSDSGIHQPLNLKQTAAMLIEKEKQREIEKFNEKE